MKLNQKVRYAVGCLFELSKTPFDYVDGDHIAERLEIPNQYAHKVLQCLSRAGYVFSQKGQGYKLARPLSEITALDVIELLTADCDPNASNPNMGVLLEKRIDQELSRFTLAELLR